MKDGESVTIKRSKGYTIHSIKPCTMERGKKMAKIRLASPPKDVLARLKKAFPHAKSHPDLGVANLVFEGKHIMVFSSGEIAIRTAKDEEDILKTAEAIAHALLE